LLEGGPVLSTGEVTAFRSWIVVAEEWSEAAQGMVGAASTLATVSCDLADLLEHEAASTEEAHVGRRELGGELRLLAEKVEQETAELRDHFLAMAADIDQYRSLGG
jgi:hypothetical protein